MVMHAEFRGVLRNGLLVQRHGWRCGDGDSWSETVKCPVVTFFRGRSESLTRVVCQSSIKPALRDK